MPTIFSALSPNLAILLPPATPSAPATNAARSTGPSAAIAALEPGTDAADVASDVRAAALVCDASATIEAGDRNDRPTSMRCSRRSSKRLKRFLLSLTLKFDSRRLHHSC